MVHLVLEDARLQARGLDQDRLAGDVPGADPRVQGALDVDDHVGEAQAPLLGGHEIVGEPFELG